jgi:hypothetical protein
MSQPIQFFNVTLKSSGEVEERAFHGNQFLVQDCDTAFLVSFDGTSFVPVKTKTRIVFDQPFDRLWFKNLPGAASNVSISIWASIAGVFIEPGNITVSKTVVKGFAAASIAGNSSVTFRGTGGTGAAFAGASYAFRKAIFITNNDPGSDLELYATDGTTHLATIFHLQAWTGETSDDLTLTNPTGTAISCRVMEIFYPFAS